MRIAILTVDDRQTHRDYSNPHPRYERAQQALLEGFSGLEGLEVHVVSCLQRRVSSPEKLAQNIWCHALEVPKIGWLRTGYQGCIRAVHRKLREIGPDIVHGQGTERECALAAVFSGFPNVLTIHGNMRAVARAQGGRFGSYYWCAAKLEPVALRRTVGVFCNSEYTEEQVRPHARRIWRVPNAIRTVFFNTPRTPRPTAGVPVILNVGVTARYKRQAEILEVAGRLWKRGLKFRLDFAGVVNPANPYATQFLQRFTEAEREGYARHLGVLGEAELIQQLDAAAAMIHFPSEESFGLVVAEALARDLKLFTCTTGGIPGIVRDVPSAVLLGQDDWAGLETQVAEWLAAGSSPTNDGAVAMRALYHPQAIATRHVDIYRDVLRGGANWRFGVN